MKAKKEKEHTEPAVRGAEAADAPESSAEAIRKDQEEPDGQTAAEQQIASVQAELDSVRNQLLRRAAEFENYKRRTEENSALLIKMANESLIVELLSVLDDFDRSLKAGAEHADSASFFNGVELIRAKLLRLLEGRGLKRFASGGQPFDVGFHDALLQIPRGDLPDHTIIEEIEPGYQLYDKVIRHAKVIVSSRPAESEQSDAPAGEPSDAENGA